MDCRILSATHQSLSELVAAGRFRQDLFYRINVIELRIPPLRDRGEDVLLIAEHYLQGLDADGRSLVLDEGARAALRAYPFPGNVRELENILERAAALCEDEAIGLDALQLEDTSFLLMADSKSDRREVEDKALAPDERARLLEALEKTRWNRTKAAQLLGMTLRALRYRLGKLGLDQDDTS